MKKLILLVLFIGLFYSCSVDDEHHIFVPDITGHWKWVQSIGGIDGRTETPASTGNEIELEFLAGFYKKYVNGELEEEMTYEIKVGESLLFGKKTLMIIYENGSKQSINLMGNKLFLIDECLDCFHNEYIRF